MRLRLLCLIALLFAATANAQEPLPDEEAMTPEEAAQMQAVRDATQAYYTRIATSLVASGGARDLAFAATLLELATRAPLDAAPAADDAPSRPSPRDPRIDQWRGLASARAGSDVLANALLMQADSPVAASQVTVRQQAAGRWQQVEPDNLAPVLYAAAPAASLLQAAQTRTRFDLHYYEQARWMQSVFRSHPRSADEATALAMLGDEDIPADQAPAIAAIGILMAVSMPALQPLSVACRGEALASTPTRRAQCVHVAQVMSAHSDTSLGAGFGIALLQQTAATSAERANADALRRRRDWQMQQWGRVSADQPLGGATQLVRLLEDPAIRSEQDVTERVLTEAGVALDPPVGWTSPWRR